MTQRNALPASIIRVLRHSATPLNGQQVARVFNVAPNTALKALKGLRGRGLVESRREGRATLWTTTADVGLLDEFGEVSQRRVALVVTAVELEHTEVRSRLINTKRVRVGGIWMVQGEVPGDKVVWTVFLARAGMGNATSAALVGLAARELSANLVAFVGTAGGLKPNDQRHLDVVVASRIHNPYIGKQVATSAGSKHLGRDRTYMVPAPLVSVVNACIADTEWTSSTHSEHYNSKHPHAFVAPIVSVESVQTDPGGPLLSDIVNRFQDAAAIDMESYGLAAGADVHDLPVLVVRGISDFVGDKADRGNDDLQPKAAGHAAALFRDILVLAHPDDFTRGSRSAETSAAGTPGDGRPQTALPGGVEVWLRRLERASPARAEVARQALETMRAGGSSAAAWLNKALHRPPAWLREDETGDGWALMSSLATIAGSSISWRGFDRAAAAALRSGEVDASSYFTLISRLQTLGEDVSADRDEGAGVTGLGGFEEPFNSRLGSVITFYGAVLQNDLAKAKSCAEAALAGLGLSDPFHVLQAPVEPVALIPMDPDVRDLLAGTVLRQLAHMMLAPGAADSLGLESGLAMRAPRGNPVTRDLADDGRRLAQWALQLRPAAEGNRLTFAQAMLAVLVSLTGRDTADVEDEVSRSARAVEDEALMVRDVYRDWDGPSGEALAVAARARTVQGDFTGSLRMLLPPPDGLATQKEAKDPAVVRLAAFVANVSGKTELALNLAKRIPDRVESQLMRAAVLSRHPQMAAEAKEALFAALEESKDRHHSTFQALNALSRQFNSLGSTERALVMDQITNLGDRDAELADVLRARVLLSRGMGEEALQFVRGLAPNELVLETHADALVATGRPEEAARLVFSEGLRRGDIPLATEALEIALDNGVFDFASQIALHLLGRADGKPVRLKALRALQRTAQAEGDWDAVARRTVEVIAEAESEGVPVPELEYWLLAEAYYFCERFEKALRVLLDAKAISFSDPARAQLFLALLHNAIDEQRAHPTGVGVADLSDPKVFAMFMRAAADWADDERIAAAAMALVLTSPDANFNEAQIGAFRSYSEEYFKRHGESASIRQINVADDDLEPLYAILREQSARHQQLRELTDLVRSGRVPLAVLTGAAGRTTAEVLIRRDLGCVVAIEDDKGVGEEDARQALGGRVVIDATALVMAPWTGLLFRRLAAHFERVLLPTPLREDIARARSSLAMRSTMSVAWDSKGQRPTVNMTSDEDAERYAAAVERAWADQQRLQVEPVRDAARQHVWLSAITVAQQLGLPVWADDVALRRFARDMGIRAFGSLDLVRVVGTASEVRSAIASLRSNRVVDLPIDSPWHILAQEDDWNVESPFALAISRPAAWSDIPAAFENFQSLVRNFPETLPPEKLAAWTHRAATGLALAADRSAGPAAISALLAWVVFSADPFFSAARYGVDGVALGQLPPDAGRITELAIEVADEISGQHFEGADTMASLINVLSEVFIEAVGPEGTSRIIAALVERLGSQAGHRIFAAYIQSAGK